MTMPGERVVRVGGIVLCGGQSRRMGTAKAWLPFGDELLLPRVVRLLRTAAWPIAVVAAAGQVLPPLPTEVVVVRDAVAGRGPLQGLLAGLTALAGHAEAAYLAGCDAPLLQPAFVPRLLDLLGDHAIAVPNVAGYLHPLAALYRLDVRDAVAELLAADRLRPVYLFEKVSTRFVAPDELSDIDPTFATLRNLNSPEDYERALRELV